jgi:hypothetical protein
MSTNMELIEAKTLTSAAGSITFSAIPQTYTDLKILVSARDDRSGQPNTDLSLRVGYNGTINTGSIYSNRQLYGNGSTAGSQSSSTDYAYLGMSNGPTSTANTFGNTEIYIPNYTSANNKSVSTDGVSENNATTAYAVLNANLISTSNPITDIQISAVYGSGNFESGSTFYLYGISNVTSTTKATGGIVSSDGTYNYHMFPFSGTFTPTEPISADILVVAGGGSGGGFIYGGGGGAGGLVYSPAYSLSATSYAVTIGSGGAGSQSTGANGTNTTFSSIYTATGGGGGGSWDAGGTKDGQNGGSGGGGSERSGVGIAGTATQASYSGLGFGNNGGIWTGGNAGGGGGSGGVGGVGGVGYGNSAGGIGKQYLSFANATQTGANNGYYAAGGGGCSNGNLPIGQGGLGGGGNGSLGIGSGVFSTAGVKNTGSGGGGDNTQAGNGGNGGSGVVIIRYAI